MHLLNDVYGLISGRGFSAIPIRDTCTLRACSDSLGKASIAHLRTTNWSPQTNTTPCEHGRPRLRAYEAPVQTHACRLAGSLEYFEKVFFDMLDCEQQWVPSAIIIKLTVKDIVCC